MSRLGWVGSLVNVPRWLYFPCGQPGPALCSLGPALLPVSRQEALGVKGKHVPSLPIPMSSWPVTEGPWAASVTPYVDWAEGRSCGCVQAGSPGTAEPCKAVGAAAV